MKIVKSSVVASVLMIGAATAYPQSVPQPGSAGSGGMNGTQLNDANSTNATSATTGGLRARPALNGTRANGTSLNVNPDPRAPDLAGKAPPQQ